MFVLMCLIFASPRRLLALLFGMDQPITPVRRAKSAPVLAAYSRQPLLAPVPAPTLRLTI